VARPCRYNPALQGSLYERRARSVSRQLCGEDMRMDYDQLLAKPPNKPEAIFHWSARGRLWLSHGSLVHPRLLGVPTACWCTQGLLVLPLLQCTHGSGAHTTFSAPTTLVHSLPWCTAALL